MKDHAIVVGAGPYGLAVSAHLRARGMDVRTIGRTMDFWERNMPAGMLLRSPWGASTISDPRGASSLDAYDGTFDTPLPRPLPLEDFVRYGRWFEQREVPGVDSRLARSVERCGEQFAVELEDGEELRTARVVVATGLAGYARTPREFASLGPDLASHASEVQRPDAFAGRSVAVIGAGQSAIEGAALVAEAGAQVEVIARAPMIRWLTRSAWLHRSPRLRRTLYAPTDVGPAGLSWLVAAPSAYRTMPRRWQDRLAVRSIRPAASDWLIPRTQSVTITTGRSVADASPDGERARLTLDDGTRRVVDHVLLATGYAVDLSRSPVLSPTLLAEVRTVAGAPVLGPGFESSVPGLHFVGAAAAWSYGPLMRFVSGTAYTAAALSARVAGARTAVAQKPSPAPAMS